MASPSDIETERQIITETVTEWNIQHGQQKNVNIEVVSWHTHSYPAYGDTPQALINKQVFDSSDLIVGVFWTQFGTPTEVAESGTEEEIERGIEQKKKVMVYFSDKPIPPSKLKASEFQKIQDFKDEYKDRGIYFSYNDDENFRKLLRSHLAAVMDELLTNISSNESSDPSDPIVPISLSSRYWTVILAALDPLVAASFKHFDKLREQKAKPEDFSQPEITAMTGPLIVRGIIVDELAKFGVINATGKENLGIESITNKMEKAQSNLHKK